MAAFDTYWNNALSTWKPFWIIHAIASQSVSDILVLQGSLIFHKIQLKGNIVNEPRSFESNELWVLFGKMVSVQTAAEVQCLCSENPYIICTGWVIVEIIFNCISV